ncbi:MAG: glycosyltransferase [Bacteroidetes bacterium]|nr:glycosyltransferase [Bacteroidota bacterium]
MLNRFSREKLVAKSDAIVISLTSYPARIEKMYQTLESIFRQTVKPDAIHVWLAEGEFPGLVLPNSLQRLKERGIRISFMTENLGSYKKLYYALQEYPKSTIITIDDDVIYPPDWLERMLKTNQENPKDIVCYRGHDLRILEPNKLMEYNELKKINRYGTESSYELMPTGVSGVLYPPNSLHSEVLNKTLFIELAPSNDDIWFKCCALLMKTMARRVFSHNVHFSMIKGSQETSLYYTNVLLKKNDEQLKRVFDHFNLYPYIALK